ncbi:MAG: acylphosphatase [Planctomycetes bacterium]|nr:acylphosphatase [Planctomycetota bacterium]
MQVCIKITYDGYVQGVGFRYRATQIAREYAVSGYVKNLPDGKVEIVVGGDKKEVKAFLDRLYESMSQHITDSTEIELPANSTFSGFGIRY